MRSDARDVSEQERAMSSQGRWIEAGELRIGDELLGRWGGIKIIDISSRIETIKVYNLHVSNTPTYTVSKHDVVVHNKARKLVSVHAYSVES